MFGPVDFDVFWVWEGGDFGYMFYRCILGGTAIRSANMQASKVRSLQKLAAPVQIVIVRRVSNCSRRTAARSRNNP